MNPHKLAVGQKLWFVETDHMGRLLGGYEVTLKTVGRLWAVPADSSYRIALATLKADGEGFNRHGRAYLSKADFDAENATVRAWDQFLRACHHLYKPPAGVTAENIAEAARLLGVRPST